MDHSSGRGHGCRLLEYTHRSLTFVTMENETLRVSVLVDKGADIVEFLHKPTDTDFLWREPAGIRAPGSLVPTIGSAWGGNLDYYEGGWHECTPGGGPTTILGASEGIHGEAALLPWSFALDEDSPRCVSVILTVRMIRVPLFIRKRLVLRSGQARLEIEESLTNESPVDIDFLWGHHPTFGRPFLDEHCRIDIPARTFTADSAFTAPRMFVEAGTKGDWPMTRGSDGKPVDLSRPAPEGSGYAGLLALPVDDGWYAVTNGRTGVGFGLRWEKELFPILYYWHVYNGVPDYPWFNRVYVVGLEPWTSFPMNHAAAVAAGTARRISGGQSIHTTLTAIAYTGREKVMCITKGGEVH